MCISMSQDYVVLFLGAFLTIEYYSELIFSSDSRVTFSMSDSCGLFFSELCDRSSMALKIKVEPPEQAIGK